MTVIYMGHERMPSTLMGTDRDSGFGIYVERDPGGLSLLGGRERGPGKWTFVMIGRRRWSWWTYT